MTAASATLPSENAPSLLGYHQFRAMGTKIELFARDAEDVAFFAPAEETFHAMEARLSRFRPASELCLMNENSGSEFHVSSVLMDILRKAQQFHRMTGGAFEPAILPDLEAAGYDRSFEEVPRLGDETTPPAISPSLSIADVHLDPALGSVLAPAGLRIDLGGIGKGFTADAAAGEMAAARNFVVNAGGDMLACGSGPDGDGWLVNITDPTGATAGVSLVRLRDEALATSTTAIRRWQRGGRTMHHLIDPRTRRPATSGVVSASVIARTATEADVFAKAVLLHGPEEGARLLREQGACGLLVMEDGRLIETSGWPGIRTTRPREGGA